VALSPLKGRNANSEIDAPDILRLHDLRAFWHTI
jgi:hypothetical protein